MSLIGISGKLGSGKDTVGSIVQWLVYRNFVDKGFIEATSIYNDWKAFTVTNYHVGWDVKKFADKLKNIVCLILGCTREELEDQEFKSKELGAEWDRHCVILDGEKKFFLTQKEAIDSTAKSGWTEKMTPRLMLQLIGTEGGRDLIHTNIWVNSLFADYKTKPEFSGSAYEESGKVEIYPNWLITDMRFPNELEAVKSRNGITIRVNRIVYEKVPCNDCQGGGCPTCNGYGYWEQPINSSAYAHPSETSLDNAEFDYVIDNNGTIEELIEKVKEILVKENII